MPDGPVLCLGCNQPFENPVLLAGPPSPLVPENFSPVQCPGCFAVQAMGSFWNAQSDQYESKVEMLIPGGAVTRILEMLREAESAGTLGDTLAAIHAERERRLALRTPQIAAILRPHFRTGASAVLAVPGMFLVERGTQVESTPEGGVSVSGCWVPVSEPEELELAEPWPRVVEQLMERPVDPEDPDLRQPVAFLQSHQGMCMLVEGTPVEILGERPETGLFALKPTRLRWAKEGKVKSLLAPIDFLLPA